MKWYVSPPARHLGNKKGMETAWLSWGPLPKDSGTGCRSRSGGSVKMTRWKIAWPLLAIFPLMDGFIRPPHRFVVCSRFQRCGLLESGLESHVRRYVVLL